MERWDDLEYNGLFLLQDTEKPCFTEDAVFLCNFLRAGTKDRVADLGAGTGLLSVLGQGKTGAAFTGIEKQEALCRLARRSAERNGQDIPFFCMDVRDAPAAFGRETFTAAVCNPPYFSSGSESPDASRALARHGDGGALEPFVDAAFQLLKNGGAFFIVWPAARLAEAILALCAARLEPKRIQLVQKHALAAPHLALIQCKKLAKPGISWEPPLILRSDG